MPINDSCDGFWPRWISPDPKNSALSETWDNQRQALKQRPQLSSLLSSKCFCGWYRYLFVFKPLIRLPLLSVPQARSISCAVKRNISHMQSHATEVRCELAYLAWKQNLIWFQKNVNIPCCCIFWPHDLSPETRSPLWKTSYRVLASSYKYEIKLSSLKSVVFLAPPCK